MTTLQKFYDDGTNLEFIIDLTWIASILCAAGFCIISITAFRHKDHLLITHPLILPLYFAGIIQWVIWGIRINDVGLIYPSIPQLVLLSPLLYRWYSRRVS